MSDALFTFPFPRVAGFAFRPADTVLQTAVAKLTEDVRVLLERFQEQTAVLRELKEELRLLRTGPAVVPEMPSPPATVVRPVSPRAEGCAAKSVISPKPLVSTDDFDNDQCDIIPVAFKQ